MTAVVRALRLDRERWAAVDEESLWVGATVVVLASFLLAFSRFGGLTATEPRSFLRLGLVGVWGWIALALALWAVGGAVIRRRPEHCSSAQARPSLARIAAVAALAHVPLLVGAVVVFVTGVMFQWLGPGRLVAAFVVVWIPTALAVGSSELFGVSRATAAAIALPPSAAWLAIVGRHLHQQVGHLL